MKELLNGVKIAINALDFKSDIPFVFDNLCSKRKIPVLHPYNFGWGAFLTIIKYQVDTSLQKYPNPTKGLR